MTDHPFTYTRTGAALVVGLFAASIVASGLHFAVVSHSVCVEHGHLVHAGQAHVAVTAHHGASGGAAYGARDSSFDTSHEHDLCVLSGASQAPLVVSVSFQFLAAPEVSCPSMGVPFIASARYRTAPKTSPPV